ncbi:hypothetical protein ACN27J_20495 [Solwaraspora sp. WMMB762]|uniref:hypothetical protein n=1 Tax=Solwaraspora sp. WMMB762 TaxID=3404120 RepID=UPI003B95D308
MPAAPVERLVNLLGGCAHGDAGECGSSGSRSAGRPPLPLALPLPFAPACPARLSWPLPAGLPSSGGWPLPGRTSAPDVTVGMTGTAMV